MTFQPREERQHALSTLYGWQDRAYKTANLMVSHLYIQQMMIDFFYLSDEIKYKLADEQKEEVGILKTSRMNTIYQVTSKRFRGKMPTNIISCLKASLYSHFKKIKLLIGEVSDLFRISKKICLFLLAQKA